MGFFDSIKRIGSKVVGAAKRIGNKALDIAGTIGRKVVQYAPVVKEVADVVSKGAGMGATYLASTGVGGAAAGVLGAVSGAAMGVSKAAGLVGKYGGKAMTQVKRLEAVRDAVRR